MSSSSPSQHPTLWYSDGSLIIKPGMLTSTPEIRVHQGVLAQHSKLISTKVAESAAKHDLASSEPMEITLEEVSYSDLEACLLHLYNIRPLSPSSPFTTLASIIRTSAPDQLDCPAILKTALEYFKTGFTNKLRPYCSHEDPEEAALIAMEYNVLPAKNMLYYILMRDQEDERREFEERFGPESYDEEDEEEETSPEYAPSGLPLSLQKVLDHLRLRIIEYFTPIMNMTPSMGSNCGNDSRASGCAGEFMNSWPDALYIDNGEYKPLETLDVMIEAMRDFAQSVDCETCPEAQIEDWKDEMDCFRGRLSEWIEEGERL